MTTRGPDWYNQAYGSFTAPSVTTTSGCTAATFWLGLGGWNGDKGLIQAGLQIVSQGSSVSIHTTFLEYWSGTNVGGNGYKNEWYLFNGYAGDDIYSDVWACDSSGDINASGGYGCFYVSDSTQGQYADCYLPTGGSWSSGGVANSPGSTCHSLAQINTFVGATAEAIIEANANTGFCSGNTGTFTQWAETNITLDATRTDTLYAGTDHNYTTDTNFAVTLTNGSDTLDEVAVDDASPDGTSFYWEHGS